MRYNQQTTIAELVGQGNVAAERLREKDYDAVTFASIMITEEGKVKFEFYLTDNFQSNLEYNDRHLHGYHTINAEELWEKISRWPGRAMREVTVLATQMGKVGGITNELRSLQVKAFVDSIQPELDELRAMIADGRGK